MQKDVLQGGEIRLLKYEEKEKRHDLLNLPEFGTMTDRAAQCGLGAAVSLL